MDPSKLVQNYGNHVMLIFAMVECLEITMDMFQLCSTHIQFHAGVPETRLAWSLLAQAIQENAQFSQIQHSQIFKQQQFLSLEY